MRKRKTIIATLPVALLAPSTLALAKQPNVVFFLTDDQRADAVGYHEQPLPGIKTPSIDRLAA